MGYKFSEKEMKPHLDFWAKLCESEEVQEYVRQNEFEDFGRFFIRGISFQMCVRKQRDRERRAKLT